MKYITLVKDASRYAAAGWLNVLILGVLIFLAENLDHLPGHSGTIGLIDLLFYAIIIFLIFFEAGYFYRIIKGTVNGSNSPPRLNRLHSMLLHGFKEVIVFFVYFSIPIIILALAAFEFQYYFNALSLNPQIFAHYVVTDIIYYYLMPSISPGEFDPGFILEIMIALAVAVIVYFFFLAAILNMGYNNGTIKSGLDVRSVYKRLTRVGVKNLLIIYILLGILTLLLGVDFFSNWLEEFPTLFDWNILDLVINIVIIPYLLISTIRLLGLISRDSDIESGN
jgi:hypothetical protein